MATRAEISETLRQLIRQVANADPANRKLALIEQLINALVSDFAALTAAFADYAQHSAQTIEALQAQNNELNKRVSQTEIIKPPQYPRSVDHDNTAA